jgi:hypothetical protein
MTRRILVLLLITLSHRAPAAAGQGGEIRLDRLLAEVNGRVITLSDLELARDLNAVLVFGRGGPPSGMRAELERLIDQELLRRELERFGVGEEESGYVQARLDELRRGYAEIGGLPALLRRLGLQETELVAYLRLQAKLLRFIDLRFKPFVSVGDDEVASYYEQSFARRLRDAGLPVPPPAEAAEKIRSILIEEKVNAALDEWLRNARSASRIEYFLDEGGPEAAAAR